jgi:hypothetical protein
VESKEVCHVLHEDVSGSYVANDSEHLSPKDSFGMAEASSGSSAGNALAGESSGDEFDRLGISELSHVLVDRDSRPAASKNVSAISLALAEPSVVPASEVEAVVEESDP